MVAERVVFRTFRTTLHNECSWLEHLLSLCDSFSEGAIIANDLLLVDNQITVVVTRNEFFLVLEIILKLFV